jgi:glucose/arabinose dehydrogenase
VDQDLECSCALRFARDVRAAAIAVALFGAAVNSCATARCERVDEEVPVAPVINVAPGYRATRVIEGLNRPTQIAFDEAGRFFVLEGGGGSKRVRIFDQTRNQIGSFEIGAKDESTGLLVLDGGKTIYVASRGVIQRFRGDNALQYTAPETIVDELPVGLSFNNNLKRGADGLIYFGLGSTCDVCDEEDERSGAILRFDPNVTGRASPEIYARGVRNAHDLIFTSKGELIATDNGPECCPIDPDECPTPGADRLLVVREDEHFGWPYIYRKRHDGGGMAIAPALVELGKYAGASGLVEYQGEALCRDKGQLFVALWGQRLGTDEGGRKVVRVRLARDAAGAITGAAIEPFLGIEGLGHPIALAVSPDDGKLYVLDYMGFVLEISGEPCS